MTNQPDDAHDVAIGALPMTDERLAELRVNGYPIPLCDGCGGPLFVVGYGLGLDSWRCPICDVPGSTRIRKPSWNPDVAECLGEIDRQRAVIAERDAEIARLRGWLTCIETGDAYYAAALAGYALAGGTVQE